MDHELLDQKVDFFADRDDTFSSIKHEFSKIFHENNLHSFTNGTNFFWFVFLLHNILFPSFFFPSTFR